MQNKGLITWLLILAFVLLLLNMPAVVSDWTKSTVRGSVAPLQHILGAGALRLDESITVFRGLGGMIRKNREMSEELIQLRTSVRALEAAEGENLQLRAQLHFAQRSSRHLIPCEVIGRDTSGWWRSIRLGAGGRDSIFPDSAVITSDGLVGRTVEVSARVTDVLLVSDPGCRVSAQISRTGAHGILEGGGEPLDGLARCRLRFINKSIPARAGDEVVTSGLGGVYPQGLLIGYVEKVYLDEGGLYQYADVIPKADLGMLNYVFVVTEEEDTLADLLRDTGPVRGGRE